MIGYRMQHEPNTQEFIKMGKEKPVGKIRLVTAAAGFMDGRTQPHWRQLKSMSGGAVFDMGVYSINAARYATGEEPIAVTAQQFVHRPELYKGVDETMLFNLEFPSGAMAQCSTSFYMNLNTLEVNAEKGSYKLSPFQSYTGVKGSTSWGKILDAPIDNQQAKQMDDNALAIMNKTAALVPGEEGLRDIRVVEAIFKSAEKGKRVLI
jgi:glucose-fructose oxidoreductase